MFSSESEMSADWRRSFLNSVTVVTNSFLVILVRCVYFVCLVLKLGVL